jgi:hypothetical protein
MNLKVHSIDGKGKLENEVIWVDVVKAVDDLSNYLICDTTYTDDNHISNELRHVYWFPKKICQETPGSLCIPKMEATARDRIIVAQPHITSTGI